jgi:hypothetical protein
VSHPNHTHATNATRIVRCALAIHLDPPGAAPFAELRARALELQLEVVVPVVSLDDLIAMKYASGQPIDRGDINALTEP